MQLASSIGSRDPGNLRTVATFLLAATVSALAIGVPSDVVDTPLFMRMTPVRWWETPVPVITAVLTGLWAAPPRSGSATEAPGGGRIVGSSLLSALAVGCPACNKLIVAALGGDCPGFG